MIKFEIVVCPAARLVKSLEQETLKLRVVGSNHTLGVFFCGPLFFFVTQLGKLNSSRVVTKISSCRVFVVSSRGSRKQSWSTSHLPQEGFEVQLLPFSKRHYRPKKAIFIKSTAIISGFMMITSLLKKTTTFSDTKIIVKLLYVKARWRAFLVATKWEYTCKYRA